MFAKAQEPQYKQRLDSIVIDQQSKIVLTYEGEKTLVKKDAYIWKNAQWQIASKTTYNYTDNKVTSMVVENYDAAGKMTKQEIKTDSDADPFKGKTIDQMIESIKSQARGENGTIINGGWVD